ncbi:bidirectional sugar transporter SWEET7b-like [Momordica charantia]|uniref:Bidirectional sugar transporter SWEET7b-like n=1 Tax=Momordica charantia TaxID=3673 RepID=A0A6J1D7I8_MOMCH|nr:bidirectional sugar transporter SWEET7b-like [Momordica charantia]
MAIVILSVILGFDGTAKRQLMAGLICTPYNIMMFSFTLFIVEEVKMTKSVKYIPFTRSLIIFLDGCIWTAYSLIIDYNLLESSALKIMSGLIQLGLYAYYSKMCSKDEEDIEHPPS